MTYNSKVRILRLSSLFLFAKIKAGSSFYTRVCFLLFLLIIVVKNVLNYTFYKRNDQIGIFAFFVFVGCIHIPNVCSVGLAKMHA